MATQIPLEIAIQAKNQASGELNNVRSSLSNIRGQVVGATAAFGALAAGGTLALKSVVSSAVSVDTAFREVRTLLPDINDQDFSTLQRGVRGVATELGVNLLESINATYEAISAGVPADNVVEFLRDSSRAAIAGVTDVTTAVNGVTSVLNAYGFETSQTQRITDIFFTTIRNGKTRFDELAAYVFRVTPLAASLGISFEQVGASLATLTAIGIPLAQATTNIQSLFRSLLAPTDTLNEAIRSLGFDSPLDLIDEVGFTRAIQLIREAIPNVDDLQEAIGRAEAVQAILGLSGNSAALALSNLNDSINSTGSALVAYNTIAEGAETQFNRFTSTVDDLKLAIGERFLPVLIPLVNGFRTVVINIGRWIEQNPELATLMATITTLAIGAAAAFAALGATIISVSLAANLFSGVIGIVAVVLTALGIAIGYLLLRYEDFGTFLYDVGNAVIQGLQFLVSNALRIVFAPIDAILDGLAGILEFINKIANSGFGQTLGLDNLTIPEETLNFIRDLSNRPIDFIDQQINNGQAALLRVRDARRAGLNQRRSGENGFQDVLDLFRGLTGINSGRTNFDSPFGNLFGGGGASVP